jgi:hypothetical protein
MHIIRTTLLVTHALLLVGFLWDRCNIRGLHVVRYPNRILFVESLLPLTPKRVWWEANEPEVWCWLWNSRVHASHNLKPNTSTVRNWSQESNAQVNRWEIRGFKKTGPKSTKEDDRLKWRSCCERQRGIVFGADVHFHLYDIERERYKPHGVRRSALLFCKGVLPQQIGFQRVKVNAWKSTHFVKCKGSCLPDFHFSNKYVNRYMHDRKRVHVCEMKKKRQISRVCMFDGVASARVWVWVNTTYV